MAPAASILPPRRWRCRGSLPLSRPSPSDRRCFDSMVSAHDGGYESRPSPRRRLAWFAQPPGRVPRPCLGHPLAVDVRRPRAQRLSLQAPLLLAVSAWSVFQRRSRGPSRSTRTTALLSRRPSTSPPARTRLWYRWLHHWHLPYALQTRFDLWPRISSLSVGRPRRRPRARWPRCDRYFARAVLPGCAHLGELHRRAAPAGASRAVPATTSFIFPPTPRGEYRRRRFLAST